VVVKSLVCLRQEITVKALFAGSRFVPGNPEDRIAPAWREPLRVSTWGLPSRGAEFFGQTGMGAYLVVHCFGQSVELGIEILMELNCPPHRQIMDRRSYAVKNIEPLGSDWGIR
jgi:hypothetical protein